MDLLLICRDALTSSLIENLLMATEAKKKGAEVAVLFTQEVLPAVAGDTFAWPRGLQGQQRRYQMADAAGKRGLPVMGSGQARQIDYRQALEQAIEAGVPIYASSIWVELLALKDRLPGSVKVIDPEDILGMLADAKTVLGSL
jgi:predicted peroxiredoxin